MGVIEVKLFDKMSHCRARMKTKKVHSSEIQTFENRIGFTYYLYYLFCSYNNYYSTLVSNKNQSFFQLKTKVISPPNLNVPNDVQMMASP